MPKDSTAAENVEELARELMRHFDTLTREFLAPELGASFSKSDVALLAFLESNGPATMSEVSSAVGLALSSATGLVDRLVERRLVERSRPESDRRTVRVVLTTRGKRALAAYMTDRVRLSRGMLERLAPRERDALIGFFRKMARSD
jgi:DNA-binding MarR family transcriptional regulator